MHLNNKPDCPECGEKEWTDYWFNYIELPKTFLQILFLRRPKKIVTHVDFDCWSCGYKWVDMPAELYLKRF